MVLVLRHCLGFAFGLKMLVILLPEGLALKGAKSNYFVLLCILNRIGGNANQEMCRRWSG